jgi:hypothetical protein
VTTYWPGGDLGCEDVALGRADVVVVTGSDATLAALAARVRGRLVAHGPRVSVAAVARAADAELAAEALALDVALHDQRGCLSPHAVYVEGDAGGFAERLAAALDALAERLPRGAASAEERAAARVFAAEAEWEPATALRAGPGGTLVLHEAAAPLRPTCGLRTLRVHPLARLEALADLLPEGETECVGVAGLEGAPLATALRARGVSRVCRLGRMQRPRLSWPRGQHAPLGILLGRHAEAALEVDA